MSTVIEHPLLRVINLSKNFGAAQGVRQINFDVYPGEVVGLAGRIGAGKTVLAMLLAGVYAATEGDIYFENKRLQWPFTIRPLGIEIIYQEPALVEQLDIASNIFLGSEERHLGLGRWLKVLNRQHMNERAQKILTQMDVPLPLDEKVSQLSSEQQQLVAIARVMTRSPKLILVDKPTSLLSEKYQNRLLSFIQGWQKGGTAVLFGSNNLDHLFAVTDRIIVLRQGRQVATFRTDETSREAVVAALLGTGEKQQPTPAIWALDNYYHAQQQAERLRYEQTLLEENLAAQDSLNRQLIDQLEDQVRALDQVNIALQAAQRRLLTEREQERKHLARELHDQLIQDLLSLNYDLEEIGGNDDIAPRLQNDLIEVQEHIRHLVDDLRRICGNLRPPTIDSLGLGAAIQSYTHEWVRRTGIHINLSVDPQLGRLPEAIELSIFRIVQEGLSNVRKHAQASEVTVQLHHTTPRMIKVSLADNGRGLTNGVDLARLSASGHYGLVGISERIALLGGRLQLRNQTEGGLLIEVEIPHPRVALN